MEYNEPDFKQPNGPDNDSDVFQICIILIAVLFSVLASCGPVILIK